MEKSSFDSRRYDEHDLNLKEWSLKARISRENTNSRRFSASNLKSFREDTKSFRSNIFISSTASSPGYHIKEEIDPSTYSFTTALKALQAKTVYSWEYLSQDGLTLNSKWNEAEKYICNPLSGQVPLECLSTKTLSARSFRRITMSAPLIYPSPSYLLHAKTTMINEEHEDEVKKITMQEKKRVTTREVGTQSTPVSDQISSSSPSPVPTPSIEERSVKHCMSTESGDSSVFSDKLKSEQEVEVKETREEEYTEKSEEGKGNKVRNHHMGSKCRCQGKCISLRGLWTRKKQREKHKSIK